MTPAKVLSISILAMALLISGNHLAFCDDKAVIVRNCVICHHEHGTAKPLAPARYSTLQWQKFFSRNKHRLYSPLPEMNEWDLEAIQRYLAQRAADAEHPEGEPLLNFDLRVETTEKKSLHREFDPVSVTGISVPDFIGRRIPNLRLAAVEKGRMKIIPAQFDEKNQNGKYIFLEGPKATPEEADLILDQQDEFIFMIKDTGDKADNPQWPKNVGQAREIAVIDRLNDKKGWIYLVSFKKNPPVELAYKSFTVISGPESPNPFEAKNKYWRMRGQNTKIRGKSYKTLLPDEICIYPEAGGTGVDILDALKIRVNITFLFGQLTFRFNESTFVGGTEAIKVGELRGFMRNWTKIVFPIGIKGPTMWQDIFLYQNYAYVYVPANIPFNPGYVITNAKASIGFDFNENAYGMKYYNSNFHEGVTIDGKMTQQEKDLDKELFDWFCVSGSQGAFAVFIGVDDKLAAMTDSITVNYIDDQNTAFPPETNPGSAGYSLMDLKVSSVDPDRYHIYISMFFPPRLHADSDKLPLKTIEEFQSIQQNPVSILIDGRMLPNEAAGYKALE